MSRLAAALAAILLCDVTHDSADPLLKEEPAHVTVRHILISFKGACRADNVGRTQEDARRLAEKIWRKAKGGADFTKLAEGYSDDPGSGEYTMCNSTAVPSPDGEFPRKGMVKGFGDLSFRLHVGQVGLLPYDAKDSPFGWHIIKRVK